MSRVVYAERKMAENKTFDLIYNPDGQGPRVKKKGQLPEQFGRRLERPALSLYACKSSLIPVSFQRTLQQLNNHDD